MIDDLDLRESFSNTRKGYQHGGTDNRVMSLFGGGGMERKTEKTW